MGKQFQFKYLFLIKNINLAFEFGDQQDLSAQEVEKFIC